MGLVERSSVKQHFMLFAVEECFLGIIPVLYIWEKMLWLDNYNSVKPHVLLATTRTETNMHFPKQSVTAAVLLCMAEKVQARSSLRLASPGGCLQSQCSSMFTLRWLDLPEGSIEVRASGYEGLPKIWSIFLMEAKRGMWLTEAELSL